MTTPYTKSNVHENSIEAFNELDLKPRNTEIFKIYAMSGKHLTDRDVLKKLTHKKGGDMNLVRPRITELVKNPDVPLTEIGRTICKVTDKRVRVVMYAPELCGIERTNYFDVYMITGGDLLFPYHTKSSKAAKIARRKGLHVLVSTMQESEYNAIPVKIESAAMFERLGG